MSSLHPLSYPLLAGNAGKEEKVKNNYVVQRLQKGSRDSGASSGHEMECGSNSVDT